MGKTVKEFTKEEEIIFISILEDFIDILESKDIDVYGTKEKADAWYKISVLFRIRSGKIRSISFLKGKYPTMRHKMKKMGIRFKTSEKSPCNQMLPSNDGLRIEMDTDNSALLEPYDPEVITQLEEDPLQLPTEKAQDTVIENDPLQLPMETKETRLLDVSHLQPKGYLEEEDGKQDRVFVKITNSSLAKGNFFKQDTKNATDERIELKKRLLKIEEARNEREKIMLQIEIEKNERERRLFHIEEERNEREKKILLLKAERNNQNERIKQLETKMVEQNRMIIQLEAERIEQDKRILRLTAERNAHHKRIISTE